MEIIWKNIPPKKYVISRRAFLKSGFVLAVGTTALTSANSVNSGLEVFSLGSQINKIASSRQFGIDIINSDYAVKQLGVASDLGNPKIVKKHVEIDAARAAELDEFRKKFDLENAPTLFEKIKLQNEALGRFILNITLACGSYRIVRICVDKLTANMPKLAVLEAERILSEHKKFSQF